MKFRAAEVDDSATIDALLDRCFGSDRQLRTAYRLRCGATAILGPTMVVIERGQLIASVQYWPVVLVDGAGARQVLTLLGPIGVAPQARGRGVGAALMQQSLVVADAIHCGAIVLIGDLDYYARFGFAATATVDWQLPGPVDQNRVLLRNPGKIVLPAKAQLLADADTYIAPVTV